MQIVAQCGIQPRSQGSNLFAMVGENHENEVGFDLHFIDPSPQVSKPGLGGSLNSQTLRKSFSMMLHDKSTFYKQADYLIQRQQYYNGSYSAFNGYQIIRDTSGSSYQIRRPISYNPWLNFNLGLFLFCSNFRKFFRVSTHQSVDKKN